MPQEAIATGAVDEVVPLPNIPDCISKFAQKK
jgi:chemotaxis response regulator CheB